MLTLLSHLSNFLLPLQFECDRHDHLDGNRLIIQIRRLILPFLQRIQCSWYRSTGPCRASGGSRAALARSSGPSVTPPSCATAAVTRVNPL